MSETPGTDKPSPQRIEEPLGRQRLQFDPADRLEHMNVPLLRDISAVAVVGDTLFAASDETSTIERLLRREDGSFRQNGLLTVYDAPADDRMDRDTHSISGDLFRLP